MEEIQKMLEQEEIKERELSETTQGAIALLKKAKAAYDKFPKEPTLKTNYETVKQKVYEKVQANIAQILLNRTSEEEEGKKIKDKQEKEKKQIQEKKERSKKAREQGSISANEAKKCKAVWDSYKKQEREKGGAAKPVKVRPLRVRFKDKLTSIAGMMPAKIKDDKAKMKALKKVTTEYFNKVKAIIGLDKIQTVKAELNKEFDKHIEKAEK